MAMLNPASQDFKLYTSDLRNQCGQYYDGLSRMSSPTLSDSSTENYRKSPESNLCAESTYSTDSGIAMSSPGSTESGFFSSYSPESLANCQPLGGTDMYLDTQVNQPTYPHGLSDPSSYHGAASDPNLAMLGGGTQNWVGNPDLYMDTSATVSSANYMLPPISEALPTSHGMHYSHQTHHAPTTTTATFQPPPNYQPNFFFTPTTVAGPPPKPKRKRIITPPQRTAANIRERKRMSSLNTAFDFLKNRIPTFSYEKKLSRLETLRLAITYISFMSDVVSSVNVPEGASPSPSTSSEDSNDSSEVTLGLWWNYRDM